MKYKHGFIGNSSSASYYIRKVYITKTNTVYVPKVVNNYFQRPGSGGVGNGTLTYENGTAATDEAVLSSTGYATESLYSWHPHNTAHMRASMSVNVIKGGEEEVGDNEGINGVKEISFRAYGAVCTDFDASTITSATAYNDDAFANAKYGVSRLYTLKTESGNYTNPETGYQLKKDTTWQINLLDVPSDDSKSTGSVGDWFAGSIVWTGTTLRIYVAFKVPSGSKTTSCAIGITDFKAIQSEVAPLPPPAE